jgi:hypothetical protein
MLAYVWTLRKSQNPIIRSEGESRVTAWNFPRRFRTRLPPYLQSWFYQTTSNTLKMQTSFTGKLENFHTLKLLPDREHFVEYVIH